MRDRVNERLEAAADLLLREARRERARIVEVGDEEAQAALTYWLNQAKRGRETVAEARTRLGISSHEDAGPATLGE